MGFEDLHIKPDYFASQAADDCGSENSDGLGLGNLEGLGSTAQWVLGYAKMALEESDLEHVVGICSLMGKKEEGPWYAGKNRIHFWR
jgi:hypothetical protein